MNKWRNITYSISTACILAFASVVSVSAQLTSKDRTEILSPERIVYMHRNDRADCDTDPVRCWRRITTQGQFLNPKNWLGTGRNSTAGLWYLSLDLIYRQNGRSFSQFLTKTSDAPCGFQVNNGKILRLDKQSRGRPSGCLQIAGKVSVKPPPHPSAIALHKQLEDAETENSAAAFFVSRNRDEGETIVGVLASPLGPVTVEPREDIAEPVTFDDIESNQTSAQIELDAGEFAFILDDGRFVEGEFSIRRFYEDNPILTLGLIDRPEDIAYAEDLEGEEEELFDEIREATLQAVIAQPEPGPFEVTTLNEPGFRSPSLPECQVLDIGDEVTVLRCF